MKNWTPLPNPFSDLPGFNCFACGPRHTHGLHLEFFKDHDFIVAPFESREDLSGVPFILHGGIQATLLDEIMWWSVFHSCNRFCLTQSMEMEFKKAVGTEGTFIARGKVLETDQNLVQAYGEIIQEDRLLVKAKGNYFLPNEKLLHRMLGKKTKSLPEKLKPYLQP